MNKSSSLRSLLCDIGGTHSCYGLSHSLKKNYFQNRTMCIWLGWGFYEYETENRRKNQYFFLSILFYAGKGEVMQCSWVHGEFVG